MRGKIFKELSVMYPTYYIGQHEGICTKPYVVLKYNEEDVSPSNKLGTFQRLEVLVYVPKNSMKILDEACLNVKVTMLYSPYIDCEFLGGLTEYLDEEKQAYMKSLRFRIPKID